MTEFDSNYINFLDFLFYYEYLLNTEKSRKKRTILVNSISRRQQMDVWYVDSILSVRRLLSLISY